VKSEPEPERNVEYVPEQLDVKGSTLEAFSDVFARFQLPPDESTVRNPPPCIINTQRSYRIARRTARAKKQKAK
jgi:splicing factor 3B subunit 2